MTTETDTHIYFLNGPFSNWYRVNFDVLTLGALIRYSNSEQYMMAAKAIEFNDEETLGKIWKTSDPRKAKALGREVKNFDPSVWNAVARDRVYQGCLAKFSQNAAIQKILIDSYPKVLVEAADYDKIWGVGLSQDDPRILDERNWLGTNWLGQVLMKVRKDIMAGEVDPRKTINWLSEPYRYN